MKSKKRVAIVGTNGIPARYGGFETLVNYLTENNNSGKIEFTVFCSRTPKNKQLKTFNNAKLIYLPFKANGSQSIAFDILSLINVWFKYDRVLLLGTSGATIIPFLKLFKKTRLIVNFGGFEWKRDKWNWMVRKLLKWSETISIRFSDTIIADNQVFVDYISDHYHKESKLIEYGGDHVNKQIPTKQIIEKYPFLNNHYGISISRAQPDNQIHLLLKAYVKSKSKEALVIISNWSKFDYGKNLLKKYKNVTNLFLLDAVYDLSVLNTLRSNASYYIHTHSFCGTAPSLVEAMHHELPIISYDAPTNIATTENKAIFFHTVSELSDILLSISSIELTQIARNMQDIAKRRYTWQKISNKYYETLL